MVGDADRGKPLARRSFPGMRPSAPSPLLLLLALAAPAAAVELAPGLDFGGFAEGFVTAARTEAGNPHHPADRSAGETDTGVDFRSDALLWAAYRVDEFSLRLDIDLFDKSPWFHQTTSGPERDAPILLEQAFIDWRQGPNLTLRVGRFRNTWLGWEGFHTPDLLRVVHSAAWEWNVQNHSLKPNQPFLSDGVGALMSTDDGRWHLETYVVNQVLGSTDDRRGLDKGLGASLWTQAAGVGRFELGTAWDPRSTNGPGGRGVHATAIDLNADITTWRDLGWTLAGDVQFHDHPDLTIGTTRYGDDLTAVAVAAYAFTPTISASLMLDYVERGFAESRNEVIETAVALLTRPHRRVRLNVELSDWHETADDADALSAAAVLLLALP